MTDTTVEGHIDMPICNTAQFFFQFVHPIGVYLPWAGSLDLI